MEKEMKIPDKKIISMKEMKRLGFSYFKINKLINEGLIVRLNNMYVENLAYEGMVTDWIYVHAYVPKGIVCLMSAAVLHNLTTYRPDAIDVAIERSKKVTTLPNWPTIQLYYYEEERYNTGIETMEVDECIIQIYDIEKTVVDILYFRNKIGIEETKEILIKYLKREDRNINKLVRYAEKLKCKEILNTYLEVLL